MAGPWEKYQQPKQSSDASTKPAAGPWAKYQRQEPPEAPRGLDMGQDGGEQSAPMLKAPPEPLPGYTLEQDAARRGFDGEELVGTYGSADGEIRASDFGLEALEGGVRGVGSAAGGTGDFLTFGGNLVESWLRKLGLGDLIDKGDAALGGMAPSDAFQAFEGWMQKGAEQIDASQTEAFREVMKNSTPEGDVFKPSTWSMGDDPSVTGYAAQMAGLIGQFAPQAATMLAGSPQRVAVAMTLMGGAQAGGSQASEAEERVMGMNETQLSEASTLYRDLRDNGLSHDEAQQQTAKTAGAAAFLGGAPIGAAGGAVTSYVLGPMQRAIGGGITGRAVKSVGLEAPAEAVQEVSETMAARANTNRAIGGNQDISEGTFGDAVLGGMFGGGLGLAGAAGGGLDATPERTPNDAVRERTPEDIAAINEQYDQQQAQREAAAQQPTEEAPQPEPTMGLQGVSDADFENAWREFERDNNLEPLDDINAPTGIEIPITGEDQGEAAEAATEQQEEGVSDSPGSQRTASVPTMMTNGMRQDLRNLGYQDADIRKMRPQEAWDIISASDQGAQPASSEEQSQANDAPAPPIAPDATRQDEQAEEGQAPPQSAPAQPAAEPALAPDQPSPNPDAKTPRRVPIESIQVDPEAYQFRTEVNEQGVDNRLEGIEKWDDLRAGNLILHERTDGSVYAADGHHRINLARQLQQPYVNAIVLREADGVTVEDARRAAAEANIAAGSATSMDAAKVFRNSEGDIDTVIRESNLPRTQLVRDGADIAKLDTEPFGAVLNKVITEKDGAVIGRSFADPDQQLAAVGVFQRVKPTNDNQRELLANEVRQAGFAESQGEQGGLFGNDPAESLIGERVKVMDSLRQTLVRDKRLFATLNDNAQTAEQAGNRIAKDRNNALQETSAEAIALLERATTTPEINQQINDAARRVKDGETLASVTRELKEALLNGTNRPTTSEGRTPAPSSGQADQAGQDTGRSEPVPAVNDARTARAGEQRPRTGAGAQAEPAVTLKADGKPFQTRKAVELSKRFRDTPNAQPVEVEGGWGFAVQDVASSQQDNEAVGRIQLTPASPKDFDLYGWRQPRGGEGQVFSIERNGEELGFADMAFFPGGEARIVDIVSNDGVGSIGTTEMRGLLRELRRIRPDIKRITGERVSGARRGGQHGFSGTGQEVAVDLPQNEAESLQLETQTEESLAQREQQVQQAEQDEADQRNQEAQRAQADRDAEDFVLSGSNRTADIAESRGQSDIFGAQPAAGRSALADDWKAQAEEALSHVPNDHPLKRKWAANVRYGLKSEGDRESVLSAMRKAAETDISDTSTSGRNGDKEIGTNSEGNTLYQDKNGVRYYLEMSGQTQFKVSESVRVTPNGTEVDTSKRSGSEFETQEEIAARNELQPEAKPKASQNTIFTEDAAEKAREVLRRKLNQLNTGIDPEMFQAGVTLAGYHIEKGARSFAAYSRAMVNDIGDAAKPYLKSWYMGVKYDPRAASFDGMDDAVTIDQADVDAILSEEATNDAPSAAPSGNANDDGSRADSVPAAEGEQRARSNAEQPSRRDRGNQGAGQGSGDSSNANGSQPTVSSRPDGGDTSIDGSIQRSRKTSPRSSARKDQSNRDYRISDGELTRTGSWRKTAEQNVEIAELIKQLDSEGRNATPAEKALLTKYTGWGASEIANGIFPDANGNYKDSKWEALGERLKSALTEQEYTQARRTTQYAHYTSEAVIRSIYDGLGRMGFSGGTVLEPGMGIGLFKGLMPANMNGTYTGIEFDGMTAKIAKALYPESNIIAGDFTKTNLPPDFFDAAIGNPPFSQTKVTGDPEYRKQNFMLHDYFFAKTIDRVRPGGLVTFVTSKGTMDKSNARARRYLAERANLVGAIRLPQTAFKQNAGTEVVTDVLFFQKRGPGIEDNGVNWLDTSSVDTDQGPAMVNEYFANNPDMVLGKHAKTSSQFRSDEYTVEPRKGESIEAAFAKAIHNLPEDIYRPGLGTQAQEAKTIERDFDPKHKKEGGIYVDDKGTLRVVENGTGVELKERATSTGKITPLNDKQKQWLKDYAGIRDALKQAQADQLNNGNWEASLKALNDAYDAFRQKHGPILAHTVTERERDDGTVSVTRRFKNGPLLDLDVESPLVYAIENIKEDGSIVKAASLLDRTLEKPKRPEIKTTQDALMVSLNQNGDLNIDDVAQLAGITKQEVIDELGDLVYNDPAKGWSMADEYLSGDVVAKLKQARQAARIDKSLERNVRALEAVQPPPLAPKDITVQLGTHWVPAADVQNFAAEALGEKISVAYSKTAASWSADGGSQGGSQWSTGDRSAGKIMDAILNNRQIRVTYRDSEGKTILDTTATEKANDVAKKMKEEFKRWIWSDAQRTERLTRYYNENFNNIVPRQFDGSHLTLPGVSLKFNLYPHQKRAIWRAIQNGNAYMAHSVGAGKTFSMIASAMEERRLGLSRKPAFVVPNHMLAQFSKEFLELYPTANIMVADEKNFHTRNRQRFVAQAALNDPDAIIMTHSSFERIGMSAKFQEQFIQKQIDDMREMLEEVGKDDRLTTKRIEQMIEQLENKLAAQTSGKKRDQALTFEEMGIDRLYVDEAHEFRKLDFATSRSNIKGIDPQGSQKAMDLFMKVQYLEQEKNPGRSLVMASGTPITNTMGELYTIQRFFQQGQLEKDGLEKFDAWSNHFGEVVEGFEQNAAGGYQIVSRFAKFVNVADLMSRVRSFMDVLTSNQLGDLVQRPNVKTGSRQVVVTPLADGYKEFQAQLSERIEAIKSRSGPPAPGDDIMLSVITDGRLSAIDMRFVDPTLPADPNSKLNVTIDQLAEAYNETADWQYRSGSTVDSNTGSTLMLFTDLGLGEASARNRGFNMKEAIRDRLIEQGVKPEHIAFMRDYKQHAKKERLFADLREGKKRILIGGKDMETGVNVQKRLSHLFHLDAPWFPASVEQREGRAVRQGNQNSDVDLRAYAAKGSYDSSMWGMIGRKARFIEQAMSGDATLRSMDDVSEASSFEMASALASGDERYLRLAGLRNDVERLNRLYSAHEREQQSMRSELSSTRDRVSSLGKKITALEKAVQQRSVIEAGSFSATLGNTVFDSRDDFGAAAFQAFKEKAESFTEGSVPLGKLGGFDLTYHGMTLKGSGDFSASLEMDVPGDGEPLAVFPIDPAMSVKGIATRAVNQVNRLDRDLSEARESLENNERRLSNIESRIGSEFAELQELTDKTNEMTDLEVELSQESEQVSDAQNEAATTEANEGSADDTRYSQSPRNRPEAPPTAAAVKADIDAMRGQLGDVVVVESTTELPPMSLLKMALNGVNPLDVRGFYEGNRLYVIAANNDSVDQAVKTAIHEAVGHKGVRGVLGDELVPVMRQLYNRLPHSKIGRQARDEVLRDYPFLDRNNPDDQVTIAEEMVAHLIEKGHRPAAWQRAVAKIKELLRRAFPAIPWTTTDVLELGEKSRDYLRRLQAEADQGNADNMTFAMRRRVDQSRVSDEFTDLDADQAEALDMIGPLSATGSAMAKVREAWDRAAVKLRAGLVDKYAALKELDEKALGRDFIESSTASSSWILARMAPAAQGALHTMIHSGRIRLDPEQKVIELQEGEKNSLHEVLAQLGDAAEVSRFMGWIAGNRAEKLREQGRENYFEERHIRGLMELNNGRAKNGEARRTLYPKVFEQFQAIRDDVLSIAEQSGLLRKAVSEPEAALVIARQYGAPEALINKIKRADISMRNDADGDMLDNAQAIYAQARQELEQWLDTYVNDTVQPDALNTPDQQYDNIMQEWASLTRDQREIWAEEFYVPFYRVLDENTHDVQGPASTAGLTRQRAYQRLKGADMRIGDLLENTLMNYHHLLSASLKNQAAMQAIENAVAVGIAGEVTESNRDPKSSTFILRDGKQVFYEISDDLVYKALVNMTDAGMKAVMDSSGLKAMRWFKRLLTNMVTVTPEFVAANTIRDSLQSAAVTPAGMNPLWNAVRGAGYYANKRNRAQMIASGGSFNFGHLYGDRSDELKAQLNRNLRRAKVINDPAAALQAGKFLWRRWNEATEFAENINRAKVYQSNLDRGKLYAAFQARDLMDFSSHGSWFMTRFLIDTVPFLNARIQGLDKLYRDGFKPTLLTAFGKGSDSDKVRAKRFSIVTGALMVASIGLLMHNNDDEEYQALPEWQKDTYWYIRNGDDAYFIPKPFEVGAISTMAERVTQQFIDDTAGGDLFKERLWHMISQTFSFSPVPQAAAPLLDIYANRDPFRDRPIEPYWDQQLSPSLRFRSSTTMPARWLSGRLESAAGSDSMLSLSPLQIDYLVNGYLGSVGGYAAGMADTFWRRANGQQAPSSRWTESRPIRRFYRNLETPAYSTRYMDVFYKGLQEADRVYADLRKMEEMGAIEEARELAQNKGDLLRLRKQLQDARGDLSDINKRMDQVRQSTEMDPDYKRRELERLRTVRNRIVEVLGREVEQQRLANDA